MKRLLPKRTTQTRVSRLDHPLGEVRVQRKSIRHLYLRLDPADGSLRVNAPRRVSDRAVRAFVTSRAGWIEEQRRKLASRPPVITEGQLPDRLHLFGEEHALVWQDDSTPRGRVRREPGTIHVRSAGVEQAHVLLREHCRREFKGVLDHRVPVWADHMALPRPETRIRRMRSRWGTCNIQARRIWLNLELVRLPVEAIDLVIVHELAHLIERGHNARFYGVMDDAYPDWRRWESTLTEYGIIGL
ncbi:M48 family metallopeptidase [Guyparkeria hydrothermalis]|uniref:M48 family metallopeptidase n=1 Tax=Guyparkeria hydrothermalis TaxID=923 RepID=UPI0020220734|nr:SprT family zinc-dependent metalloprotease [Guyparkeria hydrothermalis]MCL7751296.1 M48 family metallopeptidase [Guyparkeria hydrothermalis]